MEVKHSKKASSDADTRDTLSRMERDWDLRAREAPEYYIASARRRWRMDEFFQGGARACPKRVTEASKSGEE